MREVVIEARDVNEAIDLACSQLGVERDEIEFEIITLPKRGLFGLFGNTLAKVRVSAPDLSVKEKAKEVRPSSQQKQNRKEGPLKVEKKVAVAEPAKAARVVQENSRQKTQKKQNQEKSLQKQVQKQNQNQNQKQVSLEKGQQKNADYKFRREKEDVSRYNKPDGVKNGNRTQRETVSKHAEQMKMPENEVMEASLPLEFLDIDNANDREKLVADYVWEVLKTLHIDAQIKFARSQKGVVFQLWGDDLGVIIGRRGETLDALQYLASLVGNRGQKDYMRVTLDSGNYREKREQTLCRLAHRIASNVQRTGRSITLESMNPYERRIIHATVTTIEGVTSSSIGEEPNRRVVISSTRTSSGKNNGYRGGNHRSGRNWGKGTKYNQNRDGQHKAQRQNRSQREKISENITSTDVDKEYAVLLSKEPLPIVRERVNQSSQKPVTPVRERTKDEEDSLPLYGKIDI